MKIKCEQCWKEFEQKWKRVLCITCTNKRQKENARRYREENPEHIRELARQRYQRVKAQKLLSRND